MASVQLVIKKTFWELELVENDAKCRRSASLPPAQRKEREGDGQDFKEADCCSKHAKCPLLGDVSNQGAEPDLDELDSLKMECGHGLIANRKTSMKLGRTLTSTKKVQTVQRTPDVEELFALKNQLHQALYSSKASSMNLNHTQHLEAAMVYSVLGQCVSPWLHQRVAV